MWGVGRDSGPSQNPTPNPPPFQPPTFPSGTNDIKSSDDGGGAAGDSSALAVFDFDGGFESGILSFRSGDIIEGTCEGFHI